MNLAFGVFILCDGGYGESEQQYDGYKLRFSGIGVVEYVATRPHSSGTLALLFGGHAARVLVLAV